MSIEKVDKGPYSTTFSIRRSGPYFEPYIWRIVIPHIPDGLYSFPPLPTNPVASNLVEVIRQDFEVPGRGTLVFLTSRWPDGSNITEGPFKS